MTTFLTDLHNAICTTLKKEIPAIQTCENYPVMRTAITAPAVFLELASFEQGTNPGTEEFALRTRFEARIIVDSILANAAIIVRSFAAEVARVVNGNIWKMNVSPAEYLGENPDSLKPDLDAYLVWLVEWVHEIHQGSSIWVPTDFQSSTAYVGFTPDIGVINKPKYTKVN